MSKGNTFETELLALIFQNANMSLVGDATGLRGSSAAGSLFFALHTADPGEAGDQTTNEVAYTGYARVGVARTSGAFTVSGNAVSLAAAVEFGARSNSGVAVVATHFSVGVASSGAGKILYRGTLTPQMTISEGGIPRINAGQFVTED